MDEYHFVFSLDSHGGEAEHYGTEESEASYSLLRVLSD